MAFHLGFLILNLENVHSQVTHVWHGGTQMLFFGAGWKISEGRRWLYPPESVRTGCWLQSWTRTSGRSYSASSWTRWWSSGPSSYLSNMDVYVDWHLITPLHGNNVIGCTPTRSKVYAPQAGLPRSCPPAPTRRHSDPLRSPQGMSWRSSCHGRPGTPAGCP